MTRKRIRRITESVVDMRLAAVSLCLLLCVACGPTVESPDHPIVHKGDLAVLVHGNSPEIPLAREKEDAHALARAFETGDMTAVQAMIAAGRVWMAPARTWVRVTDESYNERRVEVVEGPQTGGAGWAPFEWLDYRRMPG